MSGTEHARDKDDPAAPETPRGPLGDTMPDKSYPKGNDDPGGPDPRTGGGQPQEERIDPSWAR